jgi:hypothetical protein
VAFKINVSLGHKEFPDESNRLGPKSFSDTKLPAFKKIPESNRAFPSSAITNFM